MPKRYSTVYIDGVKMSDPSVTSNDFDFSNVLTSQVSRVEILKGNQKFNLWKRCNWWNYSHNYKKR